MKTSQNSSTAGPAAGMTVENPAGSGIYVFTNSVGGNSQIYYILKQLP